MMNGNPTDKLDNVDMSKFNGGGTIMLNNNTNGMIAKDKNSNQPFSIPMQGYSENFKENHAEISC